MSATSKGTLRVTSDTDPRRSCHTVPETKTTRIYKDASLASFAAGRSATEYAQTRDERHYLGASAAILKTIALTDNRMAVDTPVIKSLRVSDRFFSVTSDPGETGEAWFPSYSAKEMIILVKDCWVGQHMNMNTCSMRNLNELDIHLDHGAQESLIVEELAALASTTHGLTFSQLKLAAYTLGVKINRRLYRMPEHMRETLAGGLAQPPSTARLLGYVEHFGSRQVELDEGCCVGHWNLGWVAMERKKFDTAAVHFRRSIECADAEGNDIVRGTSRIDFCGSLIFGSGPVNVVEVKDMFDEVKKICSSLKHWHVDMFVHGESSCEDLVKGFLRKYKSKLAAARQGVQGLVGGAVGEASIAGMMVPSYGSGMSSRADTRDMGDWTASPSEKPTGKYASKQLCSACGKEFISTMLCSRCKAVRYCGKDCQKSDWPSHKTTCAPLADAGEKKTKKNKKGR